MRTAALASLALVAALSGAGCGGATGAGAPTPEAPTVASLISSARKLDVDGRSGEAVPIFRQALAREPDSFEAHYGLGRALDLTGEYAEARAHFARAIDLAPASQKEQALRMMGIAWTFVGDVDQASKYFGQVYGARVAAGQFPGAADEANELGRVYLETGNIDQAERWYRTGHDTAARQTGRPASQVALADMRWAHAEARIAARRGRAADVKRYEAEVQRLLDASGDAGERIQYPYLQGYDAFHLGNYRAAVDYLRQADQTDPFILMLLAEANEKLGATGAVDTYFQRVLASGSHAVNAAFARPVARGYLEGRR